MDVSFSYDDESTSTGPGPSDSGAPRHVVVLSGDVDIARLAELEALVGGFCDSDARSVDVDLRAVEFLDSTGLAAIFRLREIAHSRGGRIRLIGPNRVVRRALDLSGASDVVDIVEW